VGLQSCTLDADIGHFNSGTDPCYGVAKHVAVEVRCSSSNQHDAHHKSNRRANRRADNTSAGANRGANNTPGKMDATLDDVMKREAGGPWYTQENYADRHGSFLEHGGQWIFVTNDRSHSTDQFNPGLFRDSVAGCVPSFVLLLFVCLFVCLHLRFMATSYTTTYVSFVRRNTAITFRIVYTTLPRPPCT
jgi:hypothetical protein